MGESLKQEWNTISCKIINLNSSLIYSMFLLCLWLGDYAIHYPWGINQIISIDPDIAVRGILLGEKYEYQTNS